ncbi:DUF2846 domain-containing protein [Luteimonas saliphila]|uniref:DUF2846 domain-containing protein n=1 Tax=Luteimonas saliphila TaxID=2804919 RepID=UPI00192D73AB|nr:DUF2846 domain-containing protein [Luteimonas saliphila]
MMHLPLRTAQLALAFLLATPAYAQDSAATDQTVPATQIPPEETAESIPTTVPLPRPEPLLDANDAPPATQDEHADAAHGEIAADDPTDDATDAGTDRETTEADAGSTAGNAAAPATLSSITVPAPPAGAGQVVFFREKKFAGGGVRFKVRENGEELGKLGSGVYFVHTTQPGVHEYVVHSESEDVLTLEVEEGETYYVQGSITMGVLVGRPNLSPSDETVFAAASTKLKPAKQ